MDLNIIIYQVRLEKKLGISMLAKNRINRLWRVGLCNISWIPDNGSNVEWIKIHYLLSPNESIVVWMSELEPMPSCV
jgi:hypothetical protein